ncbi:hypothetical protein GCM10023335_81740 [Streptomyces siamensis]|uniref:Uncharacterized protein n=1 Tax=Streptomyces siamensis TaxID=1274986 RepID=A0ABP9JP53_9ACTN
MCGPWSAQSRYTNRVGQQIRSCDRRPEPALQQYWARSGRADRRGRQVGAFVAAFSEPFYYWVWLGVSTDQERDACRQDVTIDGRVRRVAAEYRMTELYHGFTIESQETVDRDYEGRWFHRLR